MEGLVFLMFIALIYLGWRHVHLSSAHKKLNERATQLNERTTQLNDERAQLLTEGKQLTEEHQRLGEQYQETQKLLRRFDPIQNVEAEAARLEQESRAQLTKIEDKVGNQAQEFQRVREQLKALRAQVLDLGEAHDLELCGFYKPKYDLLDSKTFAAALKGIRDQQKQLVKDKTAIVCTTEWTVNGSKVEGRKQTNKLIKLGLASFNTQVDNVILKVTFKNIQASENKINKIYNNINKLIETNHCHVTQSYLNLKIKELYLAYEFAEKKQEEKEEQQHIKEQMREEARAIKEQEKAAKAAHAESERFEQALVKAREEMAARAQELEAQARSNSMLAAEAEAQQAALQAQIEALEAQLEEAQQNERAISQAQLTRRGHVYVISNIGSFGEGVYKIGMTRRLEPLIRVKELGDASVPFPFDVHAMIHAPDAPTLEKELHRRFHERRLNRINNRKEFFRVSLSEIEDAVSNIHNDEVEFTHVPGAKEYRQSRDVPTEIYDHEQGSTLLH